MKRFVSLALAVFALTAATANAQVLTTLYTVNSNAFDIIMFDLQVVNPSGITITRFDVNCNTIGAASSVLDGLSNGSPQTLSVYLRNGSFVGQNNVAAWTFSQLVPFTAATEGTPSAVPLISSITLAPGNYSFALGMVDDAVTTGAGLSFNNGSGTLATPGSGNQTFANTDIILRAGGSLGNYFGTPGSGTETLGNFAGGPRIFNGSIYYEVVVPEPSTLAMTGLGLLALARFKSVRRR
jgi:PEP-CTERM motif